MGSLELIIAFLYLLAGFVACECNSNNKCITITPPLIGGVILIFLLVILPISCVLCKRKRKKKREMDLTTAAATSASSEYRIQSASHTDFSENSYLANKTDKELRSISKTPGFTSVSLRVPDDDGGDITLEDSSSSGTTKAVVEMTNELPDESHVMCDIAKESTTTGDIGGMIRMNLRDVVEIHPFKKRTQQQSSVTTHDVAGDKNRRHSYEDVNKTPHNYDKVFVEEVVNSKDSECPRARAVEHMYHQLESDTKNEEEEVAEDGYSTTQTHSLVASKVDDGKPTNKKKNHVYHVLDGSSPSECGIVVAALSRGGSSKRSASEIKHTDKINEEVKRRNKDGVVDPKHDQSLLSKHPPSRRTTFSSSSHASKETDPIFDDPAYEYTVLKDKDDPISSSRVSSVNPNDSTEVHPRTQSVLQTAREHTQRHNNYETTADIGGIGDFSEAEEPSTVDVKGFTPKTTRVSSQRRQPRSKEVYESKVLFDDPLYDQAGGMN